MLQLRKNPHIYEINLMPWLNNLCEKEKRKLTLKTVPDRVWANIKKRGIDLVWLMGVWHRSKNSRENARSQPNLIKKSRSILQNFKIEDIMGSPYAIDRYIPDPAFGSAEDLLSLKQRLEDLGLALILDYVPNHTACDHFWVSQNPEYYVRAKPAGKARGSKAFFTINNAMKRQRIAHGRDPFFHPWVDTAQINYGNQKAVSAMIETLANIALYCHGVRCDMAMLVLKKVFNKTWSRYVEKTKGAEFWTLVIENLRSKGLPCIMLAEVYWGMEQDLIDLGFDYTYDKTLYDLMVDENIEDLKSHLSAPSYYQEKMVRFLENHDEPRAMDIFGPKRIYSAMVTLATLPGMRLWYHGQFEGNSIKVPIHLGRGLSEPIVPEYATFAKKLLKEVDHPVFHDGVWKMCETLGWSDDRSTYNLLAPCNLLAWCWQKGRERRLIVVNISSAIAKGSVRTPANWLPAARQFICFDPLKGDRYLRMANQVEASGLQVELGARDFHFFKITKE